MRDEKGPWVRRQQPGGSDDCWAAGGEEREEVEMRLGALDAGDGQEKEPLCRKKLSDLEVASKSESVTHSCGSVYTPGNSSSGQNENTFIVSHVGTWHCSFIQELSVVLLFAVLTIIINIPNIRRFLLPPAGNAGCEHGVLGVVFQIVLFCFQIFIHLSNITIYG